MDQNANNMNSNMNSGTNNNTMPNHNNNSSAIKWLSIAIIAAAVIVSGTILYTENKGGSGNNTGDNTQVQGTTQTADITKVNLQGEPFVGDQNAPVVVAVWTDYQCPFCQRFESDAINSVYNDYVKSGKVKIVFKDYAFLGADSTTLALAARAVWEVAPDKFYDWRTMIYQKQGEENSGWGTKDKVLALTKTIPGIDSVKVGQLMTSKADEYQKAMDADKAEGTAMGISGTPGTIIGNQMISGAQPYSTVKAAIDAQLQ